LTVKHRIFKYATDPPDNFHIFPDDTLCTHMDQHGGEKRVDLIHYRKDRVVYIEATVAKYCDAKIPHEEGTKREEAIVESFQKWLGEDTFVVKLEEAATTYLGSRPSPKKLVATYKKKSRKPRPDPPQLLYVVATTCPRSVKLSKQRTVKSSWIGVCFLDDLIASNVIPAEIEGDIIRAQAMNAGRPS
jgi:hypothetical protein